MRIDALKKMTLGLITIFASMTSPSLAEPNPFSEIIPTSPVDFTKLPCYTPQIDLIRREALKNIVIASTSMNYIREYQGTATNPNISTNTLALDNFYANILFSFYAIEDFLAQLSLLGVSDSEIETLQNSIIEYGFAAIIYCLDTNLANTGQPSGDATVDAEVLFNTGMATGNLFFQLTNDVAFVKIWSDLSIMVTQNVQAYRGVLVDPDFFGSSLDPSDTLGEAVAATTFSQQITASFIYFSDLLIFDLAKNLPCPSSSGKVESKKHHRDHSNDKKSLKERIEELKEKIQKRREKKNH